MTLSVVVVEVVMLVLVVVDVAVVVIIAGRRQEVLDEGKARALPSRGATV